MSASAKWLMFVLLTAIFGFQTGCMSLGDLIGKRDSELDTRLLSQQGYAIPPGGMPTKISDSRMLGIPSIVLEVRSDSHHLERIPLPTDRTLLIEDLVRQAQLSKRLGRLNISIMRQGEPGAPPVQMTVNIDGDGKASSLGSNYALRPGDHVIVNLDDKSALEMFLEKKLGLGNIS